MIRNGASGYLLKNVHPAEREKALDTLVSKGFYYPDLATNKILHEIQTDKTRKSNQVDLTDREVEFLQYAATELTYKEIAEK